VVQDGYCGSGGVLWFRTGIAVQEGYCGSGGVLWFRTGIVVQDGYCGSGGVLRLVGLSLVHSLVSGGGCTLFVLLT